MKKIDAETKSLEKFLEETCGFNQLLEKIN